MKTHARVFCLTLVLMMVAAWTPAGQTAFASSVSFQVPSATATAKAGAKPDDPTNPAETADTAGEVYGGGTRSQFNLREEPDIGAKRLKNIGQGKKFTMLENTNDQWCLIESGSARGYAKKSWLKFDKEPDKTGDSGFSADSGIQYICRVYHKGAHLYQEADKSSPVIYDTRQYETLYVISYAPDWCQVQLQSGKQTGYIPTGDMFHYQSTNSFLYSVPGYDEWRMTGSLILKRDLKINDHGKYYAGNELCEGDLFTAQLGDDGVVRLMLRKELIPLDPADYDYTPFVPWREAKEGDCIYGYTQFYGRKQGGGLAGNRKKNINLAIQHLDGYLLKKGEEFVYQKAIGPLTSVEGYVRGGITGGGTAIGGGVCHVSTCCYQAALGLPFLITEREPHTTEGATYAPFEFDATVGMYSDLRFINTLPYDVKFEATICKPSGTFTIRFFCAETIDSDVLANWEK